MSTTDLEPVSGEIVGSGHERTLFHTDDPVEVLDRARAVADALKTALDEGGMTMRIRQSEHVLIDGWQTLGSMLGVSAHVAWSRPLPDGNGWEARAEARTVDGRVVGSGEAMVTTDERNWRGAEQYALRSMAQTRAMSKALRGPLGFVITLAGRNATPAEEAVASSSSSPGEWADDVLEVGAAATRFADNLESILVAAGITDEPEVRALEVANGVVNYCNGALPAACALLARLLAQAIAEPVPPAAEAESELEPEDAELASDSPAAGAPDIPPEGENA